MLRLRSVVTVGVLIGSLTTSLTAQKTTALQTGEGGSPHVRSVWTIDGATITVEYGRPYLKGRPEAVMMPAGQPWRTGADAATVLTSTKPLTFGTVTLPAGSHTINTIPGDAGWQLLLGRTKREQWGVPYERSLEVAKVPMAVSATAPAEQVTISIDDTPAGATLRVEWGTRRATAPFTVG